MPDFWMVKDIFTPLAEGSFSAELAMADGNPFSFWRGDQLTSDDSKTVKQEKDGIILLEWLWLSDGQRAGYVPYNPGNPDAFNSVAVPWDPSTPKLDRLNLFDEIISREAFAEACVRKAIRWKANAAYLYALAFVESGSLWPAGKVSSPPSDPGQLAIGTFRFLPATWRTLVDKLGAEQFISADDIIYPQAQTTFAAAQAGETAEELQKRLEREPRYVDLYLAHMFTITGCVKILEAAEANAPTLLDALLADIYANLDQAVREARIKSIMDRKAELLTSNGTALPAATVVTNCIADLDKGFAHVKQVAAELSGHSTITSDKTVHSETITSEKLGILSEEFESNGNPGAIGFDGTGGFSYGAWQIATRTGTFSKFMRYLETNAPNIKSTLDAAGGTEAAKNGTDAFKNAWRSLKNSREFLTLQHDFIKETHYDVMVKNLGSKLDIETQPNTIKNVIWSVAVQHGPSSRIVGLCIDDVGATDPARLINRIYVERSKVNIYFRRSKPNIKAAVLNRFKKERALALEMLKNELAG